jgi:hypothetical protein
MRWHACMLREFNLVGCSYIDIIEYDSKRKNVNGFVNSFLGRGGELKTYEYLGLFEDTR